MSEILDALSTGVDALSESLADSRAKEADALIPEVRKLVDEWETRTKKMRSKKVKPRKDKEQ